MQPPSGGCVLKPRKCSDTGQGQMQPPSGGCVLKLSEMENVADYGGSRLRAAVC